MILIKINDFEFSVSSNISALEACKFVGINIPRFCYHEMLSVAGNCRMCLIEVEKLPKPVASCALPISNNITLYTETTLVKKARENVLETLLLNHPLDCPICDQAGECDLQDQTKLFGGDYSRYFFDKRGLEDKYCGPLIKTIMTRCIHCTRCVRFGTEIAGFEFLGTLNRGTNTEIGSYVTSFFNSEISGNVIDLCPVGALTSKPYVFKARPWELKLTESVDLTDSYGSNIYINFKESDIVRILPKKTLNESIISDKTRFSFDSYKKNRLVDLFKNSSNLFTKSSWFSFFSDLNSLIDSKKKITILIDNQLDTLQIDFLKQLSFDKNYAIKIRSVFKKKNKPSYSSYSVDNINFLNKKSQLCLIFASNLKAESAILNLKIRRKFVENDFLVYSFGLKVSSNFKTNFINLRPDYLFNIFEGKDLKFSNYLLKKLSPICIFGESFLNKYIGNNFFLFPFLKKINPNISLFELYKSCNASGDSVLNVLSVSKKDILESDILFCLNLDDTFTITKILNSFKGKIFWFNSNVFLNSLKKKISYFIPINGIFEHEGLYLNFEEKPQFVEKTFETLGNSVDLKHVLQSIFYKFDLKRKSALIDFLSETAKNENTFYSKGFFSFTLNNFFGLSKISYNKNNQYRNIFFFDNCTFSSILEDAYRSNKFTKNSNIMYQCSNEHRKTFTNFDFFI